MVTFNLDRISFQVNIGILMTVIFLDNPKWKAQVAMYFFAIL